MATVDRVCKRIPGLLHILLTGGRGFLARFSRSLFACFPVPRRYLVQSGETNGLSPRVNIERRVEFSLP